MATSGQGSFGRRCRKCFRFLRMCLLLLTVAVLAALFYLNQVGLPDFIKNPLCEKLRARGLNLEFSRLRWRAGRGLVAENVRFGPATNAAEPTLTAREMRLMFDYPALLKRQFQ